MENGFTYLCLLPGIGSTPKHTLDAKDFLHYL